MPTNVEIQCVTKTKRFGAHQRIRSVGGTRHDGTRWRLSTEAAIAGIELGRWRFYVASGARAVGVIIATSPGGHQYLKTENDGDQPDNLLSLPECP